MEVYAQIRNPTKLVIYDSPKRQYSAAQVRALTGCDLVINGGLYDLRTGKPNCHLRIDRQTIAAEDWSRPGFGWNTGSAEVQMLEARDMARHDNFIDCVELIQDGEPCWLQYPNALGGARGRTVWGVMPDGSLFAYVVPDDDRTNACTVERLQQQVYAMRARDAIMMDTGSSSQASSATRNVKSPTCRCVRNYICFWGEVELFDSLAAFQAATAKKEEENTMADKTVSVQLWTKSDALRNSALTPKGIMVHSTATPGVSAQSFRDRWNRAGVGASVHYFVDNQDIIQCLPLSKRAGHAAGTANQTHLAFEICEPSGLTYNSNGSVITQYNPPTGYFQAAWENAVWLCAKLCKEYSLNPLTAILSHAEGYKKGIASNHADTAHWFKWEGKTMDDFRQEVKDLLDSKTTDSKTKENGAEMSYEKFKEYMTRYMEEAVTSAPSDWAKASCEKAIEKGIMKGNGNGAYNFQRPLTREAYLVMQDRAGLL